MISQTRRAARSATNNLAEGFGRYHYQEFIRFCRISRGSLTELTDHVIIACDEQYISEEKLQEIKAKIERSKALINGFINYLEGKKIKGSKVEEPFGNYLIPNE